MPTMRAKMVINRIESYSSNENLTLNAVATNSAYPEDGLDENKTYAKFTPNAKLDITIANPALMGKFKVGDVFYVDFTPAQ